MRTESFLGFTVLLLRGSRHTLAWMMLSLFAPTKVIGQNALLISRPRSEIAITITGRSLPDASSLLNDAQSGCRLTPALARDAGKRIERSVTAAVPESLPSGLVVVTVTTTANTRCGSVNSTRAELTAAALELRKPAPHAPLAFVTVVVSDSAVTPLFSRAIPTTRLWARDDVLRDTSVPGTALQIALPIELFTAKDDTDVARVALLITRQGEVNVERVELSVQVLEALWRLVIPARMGAIREDTSVAMKFSRVPNLSRSDLPFAAVALQKLSSRGDSLAVHWLARQLVEAEPCLRLPRDADALAANSLERYRPRAHCRSQQLNVVLLRGALVPGLGQRSSRWRSVAGALVLGLFAQQVYASRESKLEARRYYQQYVDATTTFYAEEYWGRAERARRRTDSHLLLASTLWVGALTEATLYELRLGRRLRFSSPIVPP